MITLGWLLIAHLNVGFTPPRRQTQYINTYSCKITAGSTGSARGYDLIDHGMDYTVGADINHALNSSL
jgi:hypothetical protein